MEKYVAKVQFALFCLLFDIASLVVSALELDIMFFCPVDRPLQDNSHDRKRGSKIPRGSLLLGIWSWWSWC
jgi:hypothetical protein